MKGKSLKKYILRGALGLLAFFLLTLGGYILSLVVELNHLLVIPSVKEVGETRAVKFETLGIVQREHFDFFQALSMQPAQAIKPVANNLYEVQQDFALQIPARQDCLELNCLQFKLAFADIPSVIWRSLIGIEDARFLEHEGVDWKALARAIWVDVRLGKMAQGGSTITQQLAKNLFLSQEKSFKRKLKEMIYSFLIEIKYSKQEILTAYLNEVFWGSFSGIRIKGVAAASVFYFGKHVQHLTEYESAILISLLKGPYYLSPLHHLDRLKNRVSQVFKKLQDESLMGKSAIEWGRSEYELFQKNIQKNINLALPYAVWTVYEFTHHDIPQKEDPLEAYKKYIIAAKSQQVLHELKSKYPSSDFASKISVIKTTCHSIECASYFYYSKNQRNRELAYRQDKHQLGSILKPIVYEALIEKGVQWGDKVETSEIELSLKSGAWKPKEVSRSSELEITVTEALQKSRNIPMIRLVDKVGFKTMQEILKARIPGLLLPLDQYPSQLLGALEKPMVEIEKIFQDFIQRQCLQIRQGGMTIADSTLGQLGTPEFTTVRTQALNLTKQHNFFGKTGTSNSGLDSWFVGFDGQYLTIIWVGDESRGAAKNYKHGGAGIAFPIFQDFYLYSGQRIMEFDCL
jgi:penicillin-binding protein 1B